MSMPVSHECCLSFRFSDNNFVSCPFFALSLTFMVHVTLNIGYRELANTIMCLVT